MFERLEALSALAATGTMGRAATMLRITQSAISKRIAALEREVGEPLIERSGRMVRLTTDGERLLHEAKPLLAALHDVVHGRAARARSVLKVAATDSLLASWLPATLRHALDRLPDVSLELHAHRGPVLLDRLRSGAYLLGFCPAVASDKELLVREVAREAMVVVPARLEPLARESVLKVWTIEERSLSWEAMARRLARLKRTLGFAVEVEGRLESFAALVQIARTGFANALVPIGVARALGVPADRLIRLGDLSRPIAVVGRRTSFEHPAARALLGELAALWPR